MRDGGLELAGLRVRARHVVEDVRVREDLVGALELGDAVLVFALPDGIHALLEVGAGLGARVGLSARGEGRRAHERRAAGPKGPESPRKGARSRGRLAAEQRAATLRPWMIA